MLPAQAHVVTAAVKTLDRQNAVFLCCECGTGKTQMGVCTAHAHAAGKPYRAIVMCPPHLVETWQAELRQVFREGTVEVQVLEKWRELLSYPRAKPTKPTWLIMGETVAKNGPYWRAAAVKDRRGMLRCPDCGAQLREKANGEGSFLSMKDLERSRKRCTAEITVDCDKDGKPQFTRENQPHSPGGRMFTRHLNPSREAPVSKACFSRPKFTVVLAHRRSTP